MAPSPRRPLLRLASALALAAAMLASPSAGCPALCRCDGTFVYCNDRALTSVPSGVPRDATTLFLQNNLINDAGIPAELARLRHVDTVHLYGNQLEEFPVNLPPGVRELHLQENRVRVVSRAALARLPALERLHLDDNMVNSVGVERGAFAGAVALKVLFLSRNFLSAVPAGLPRGLEELQLDDNRIGGISEHALAGLAGLKRLFLEGNQLSEKSIAERAFRDLDGLVELSLARNALGSVPAELPAARLQRLYLQDNRIARVPAGALADMRQLLRLDLSGNSLGTLPAGAFDGLSRLAQLSVRNNPWRCTCALLWLQEWMRLRSSLTMVRGMVCQAPEAARGTPLDRLALGCHATGDGAGRAGVAAPGGAPGGAQAAATEAAARERPDGRGRPATATARPGPPRTAPPRAPEPEGDADDGRLEVRLTDVTDGSLRVSWRAPAGVKVLKLNWARLGQSSPASGDDRGGGNAGGGGDADKVIVAGDGGGGGGHQIPHLQPGSTYRVCAVVMDPGDDRRLADLHTCAEARTLSPSDFNSSVLMNREQGMEPGGAAGGGGAGAGGGVIGGAVAAVAAAACLAALAAYALRVRCRRLAGGTGACGGGGQRRKACDYADAAGKKKDMLSTLEGCDGASFQVVPLNGAHPARDEFTIQTVFPQRHGGAGIGGVGGGGVGSCVGGGVGVGGCGSGLAYKYHQNASGEGHRGRRDSGVPDSDHSQT